MVQQTNMWYNCINMGGIRLIPLLVIFLIGFFIYNIFKKNTCKEKFNTDLDTLKYRYVKGEIDKDEYNTIKKDIS